MKKCFIVGCQRSGTTWIQRLIQSHPLVCGSEESHFFRLFAPALADAREMISRQRKIGPLVYTSEARLISLIRDLWNSIFSDYLDNCRDALIHVEKTPDHALHLDEIIDVFPDSKVIVVYRDSRAVVSSLVAAGKDWGKHWAPKNYRDAAVRWWVYYDFIENWRKANPDIPCMGLRYENCFEDPIGTMRDTFKFLELPPVDDDELYQCLDKINCNTGRDPKGFARMRGNEGWKDDLSLFGKFVTWRYTRKMMANLGYDCRLLG